MVGLLLLSFFVISLLTNILGPIIPDIIRDFHVSLGAAGFLVFSFFIAYGVMSIPAGLLVQVLHEKFAMVASLVTAAAGALCFARFPGYHVAMISLFVIGAGMATLQVAINPLLRVTGGEEHFALNEVLAQFLFGAASFVSPWIYSYLVVHLTDTSRPRNAIVDLLRRITPQSLPWVSIYWVFACVAIALVLLLVVSRFPQVEQTEEERPGTRQMYGSLLRQSTVWLYFFAIFAYVGCEQGISNWISEFLSRYHGFDPHTVGAHATSWFWGLMTLGCLVGMFLMKLFDSRRILLGVAAGAIIALSFALFGSARMSLMAFPAIGLFASVMWPTLISLGLNSVSEYHGSLTGILATGIMGGAIVSAAIGRAGDSVGLRWALCILYVNFGFIFSVGIWARPLINNATIWTKQENVRASAAPSRAKGLVVKEDRS
jgi:fucose permease